MAMKVKAQKHDDNYSVYNADCMEVLPHIPDESVGLSIFSPPFADLYSYSDELEDMSNASSYEEFFEHFRFLAEQLERIMMPGRNVAIHCMDLPTFKRSGEEIGQRDFPGDILRCFEEFEFVYHARFCIWKDPLIAATRSKAIGLMHKQLVKDSAICRTGIPDYVIVVRKKGDNPKPIPHKRGLTTYYGGRRMPHNLSKFEGYEGDQGENKRSQWIWQRYASPIWDDIRQGEVLPFRKAREEDDMKHICPLQLDVIERCLVLWAAEGDVVLTPFMGVGSEVYCALRNGCKAIGIELKSSYYRQALKNIRSVQTEQKGFIQ